MTCLKKHTVTSSKCCVKWWKPQHCYINVYGFLLFADLSACLWLIECMALCVNLICWWCHTSFRICDHSFPFLRMLWTCCKRHRHFAGDFHPRYRFSSFPSSTFPIAITFPSHSHHVPKPTFSRLVFPIIFPDAPCMVYLPTFGHLG
jgi:hypothetical protein